MPNTRATIGTAAERGQDLFRFLSAATRSSRGARIVACKRIFCHLTAVNSGATAVVEPSSQSINATEELARTWIRFCNDFRRRERREIIEQIPSSERLAKYREELKWMIRGGRALLNLVGDLDFPDPQFAP